MPLATVCARLTRAAHARDEQTARERHGASSRRPAPALRLFAQAPFGHAGVVSYATSWNLSWNLRPPEKNLSSKVEGTPAGLRACGPQTERVLWKLAEVLSHVSRSLALAPEDDCGASL